MDPILEAARNCDWGEGSKEGDNTIMLPKPDLESFGFVVNNGRPRFQLDEPVSRSSYLNFQLTEEEQKTTEDNLLNDSDTSFVILGKKSLDSIQASSLATYADILQKSTSLDFTLPISCLSSSEIQDKLTKLFQENTKLKETLKQNTTVMKQQFNTLVTWQEEVMNIHNRHKQKFIETKRLIDVFKQENAELKLKLGITNMDSANSGDIKQIDNSVQLYEVQKKISSLFGKINDLQSNCAQLCEDIEKCINLSNTINIKENIKEKETSDSKTEQDLIIDKSVSSAPSNSCEIKEINSNSLLEDEIKSLHSSINLSMEQMLIHVISPQSHYFTQSIKQYGEMLQELTECFITQIPRYSAIQKCIKECTDILDACENIKLPEQCDTVKESWSLQLRQLQIYKEKLFINQKILHEEQLKLITDKQCFIKIQNQFQKIFSDYNSILYELQITTEEKNKLHIMKDNITKESSQRISELEQYKCESEKKYKEVKDILEQERQSWNEQKKLLDNQRQSLNMEYKSLIDQKKMLFISPDDKTCKQFQIHQDNEKLLQTEKDTLEKNYKTLIAKVYSLRTSLEEKDDNIHMLQMDIEEKDRQLQEQKEKIELLETQAKYYVEDFKFEKEAREKLLLEKRELEEQLSIRARNCKC